MAPQSLGWQHATHRKRPGNAAPAGARSHRVARIDEAVAAGPAGAADTHRVLILPGSQAGDDAVGPGPGPGRLRLLLQYALLGCRVGSVGQHALVVQLGQHAQLRYPRRLVIRSHGRGRGGAGG